MWVSFESSRKLQGLEDQLRQPIPRALFLMWAHFWYFCIFHSFHIDSIVNLLNSQSLLCCLIYRPRNLWIYIELFHSNQVCFVFKYTEKKNLIVKITMIKNPSAKYQHLQTWFFFLINIKYWNNNICQRSIDIQELFQTEVDLGLVYFWNKWTKFGIQETWYPWKSVKKNLTFPCLTI